MNLPCDPILLSRLHDGETSPDEAAVLEQHLRGCAECRATLAGYRRMSAVFDRSVAPVLSESERARILQAAVAAQRSMVILSMARPFAVAAGLILALGLPMLLALPTGERANTRALTLTPPVPATWETTLLVRDSDPARSSEQIQFAEFVVDDLAMARR